jgi:hypothetical protein
MNKPLPALFALVVLPLTLALGQAPAKNEPPAKSEPPLKIDIRSLPSQATLVDDVVVPIPSEIFGALDKVGKKPHWDQVLRSPKDEVPREAPQIALQFGTVIAEGFIAVEAENVEEVKKIGGTVRKLAAALGVAKHVEEHAKAILDSANNKDWVNVRKELDMTLKDVKNAMNELGSESLSQLISLGGWLRGTEALTDVVGKAYSQDGAELLHQPVLLDYFEKRLTNMPAKYKKHPLIADMRKGVIEIRPLVGIGDGSRISEKSVKDVGSVAERLVKSINSKIN